MPGQEPGPVERPWLLRHRPTRLSLAGTSWGEVFAHRKPQVLAATYWLDAESVASGAVTHVGFTATDQAKAQRSVVRALEPVKQTTGPVAVTGVISDVPAGAWQVTAAPVANVAPRERWVTAPRAGAPAATVTGTPLYGPLATMLSPGVVFGAWPALVFVAFLLAAGVQAALGGVLGLPVGTLATISVAAATLGLGGAKGYFLLTHRGRSRPAAVSQGLSVQGFVIVTLGVLVTATLVVDLPLGAVLDASAPALLAGQAVGRLGCILSGCCVGRPTASRWGVWSSDRRLGCRRVPVQLMESIAAAAIAVAAAAAVLVVRDGSGAVMLGAVAANVLVRQALFALRQEPRTVRRGRTASTLAAGAALLVALVMIAV